MAVRFTSTASRYSTVAVTLAGRNTSGQTTAARVNAAAKKTAAAKTGSTTRNTVTAKTTSVVKNSTAAKRTVSKTTKTAGSKGTSAYTSAINAGKKATSSKAGSVASAAAKTVVSASVAAKTYNAKTKTAGKTSTKTITQTRQTQSVRPSTQSGLIKTSNSVEEQTSKKKGNGISSFCNTASQVINGMTFSEKVHTALDVVGMVPVLGEVCDATNAV
ncbi:MAG: hypothetical protein J6J42_01850, partial [Lachnospiraceae bacterium]|nr:hypothetical protein [Lachnospiraceae bacterium]